MSNVKRLKVIFWEDSSKILARINGKNLGIVRQLGDFDSIS